MVDSKALQTFCDNDWNNSILSDDNPNSLKKFVENRVCSPAFPDWNKDTAIEAGNLLKGHVEALGIPDCTVELFTEKDTPLLYVEITGEEKCEETVLMYGHFDKQPPLEGWTVGGPFTPTMQDGKLYGRGSSDDGYCIYAIMTAIRALKDQGLPHARLVFIMEAGEESGSPDIEDYLSDLSGRIGDNVGLLFILDSGAGRYDEFWLTTSLRGVVSGTLKIATMSSGIHSGVGSGVIPPTMRIWRQLQDRIEDPNTGEMKVPAMTVDIPADHRKYNEDAADLLGDSVWNEFPFLDGVSAMQGDNRTLLLNKTWGAFNEVIGTDVSTLPNMPGSNLVRPETSFRLSIRIPPTANPEECYQGMKNILEQNPPHGAHVTLDENPADKQALDGWSMLPLDEWLTGSIANASNTYWGAPPQFLGEGGTIPVITTLQNIYGATTLVTGVLGPGSNAHAPNENLDIAFAKKITAGAAHILYDHYQNVVVNPTESVKEKVKDRCGKFVRPEKGKGKHKKKAGKHGSKLHAKGTACSY